MRLYLFKDFAKRKNSTKQPVLNTANLSLDVYLKIDTDYEAPSFEIAAAPYNFPVFTYAYLDDVSRYYYVATCKQRNSQKWEIICELDVLATFKSAIQSMSAYVAFSSTDFNPLLNDTRVARLNDVNMYVDDRNTPFGDHHIDILWVAGESGTVPYVCSVRDVTKAIFEASKDDLIDNLAQTWSDIQSCILYARSFGLDYTPSGTAESIKIGKYDTGVQGVRLSENNLRLVRNLSIPISGAYTDFRRFAFTEMKISLPFVGVAPLSISDFVSDPTQTANVNIDIAFSLASGVVTYVISNDEGAVIATFNGVAGRAKPVSVYSPYNGIGVLTSGGAALAGAAALAFGPAGIGIAGACGAIAATASMLGATEESSGSTVGTNDGSIEEEINDSIVLTVEEYTSNVEPATLTAIAGRPCGKVRSLTDLSGYVQTSGASISVNANSNVIDEINALLDNGIYIE